MEISDHPHGEHDAGWQEYPMFKKIVEVAPGVDALDELEAAEGSLLEQRGQEPRCSALPILTRHASPL
jgi:hypothetical protein